MFGKVTTLTIKKVEKGGLKMPDLVSMIATQTIICIKRYLAPTIIASWKFILESYLKRGGGGKFLFQSNFGYSKLNFLNPS